MLYFVLARWWLCDIIEFIFLSVYPAQIYVSVVNMYVRWLIFWYLSSAEVILAV